MTGSQLSLSHVAENGKLTKKNYRLVKEIQKRVSLHSEHT